MASEWWWFLVLNAIVAAIAIMNMARPPSSPRGCGITRRASSAVLQRLRSSLFSFPSAGFHAAPAPLSHETEEAAVAPPVKPVSTLRALAATPPAAPALHAQPEAAAATVSRGTEEPAAEAPPAKPATSTPRRPRALAATPPSRPRAPSPKEVEMEEKDDPNAMSMEEAYALVQAARRRPEPARQPSDVDAKAEEFIQGFKEDLRQQRLNSIFNYTQMLKQRAFGGGRRAPPAAASQQDQR